MRVKLNTFMAGPNGSFPIGSIVDLPDASAKHLIATRQAVAVPAPVVAPVVGTAGTVPAPKAAETAARTPATETAAKPAATAEKPTPPAK